jgi:hypothetical protein
MMSVVVEDIADSARRRHAVDVDYLNTTLSQMHSTVERHAGKWYSFHYVCFFPFFFLCSYCSFGVDYLNTTLSRMHSTLSR